VITGALMLSRCALRAYHSATGSRCMLDEPQKKKAPDVGRGHRRKVGPGQGNAHARNVVQKKLPSCDGAAASPVTGEVAL
jgi:hypothetical protein